MQKKTPVQISVVFQNASSSIRLCLACLLYKSKKEEKNFYCKAIFYYIRLAQAEPLCAANVLKNNQTTLLSREHFKYYWRVLNSYFQEVSNKYHFLICFHQCSGSGAGSGSTGSTCFWASRIRIH
jgi:hypothetical protein